MQEMDHRDRDLLTILQSEVPLASTPYAMVGQAIDMSEKEVIKRIERLKRDGVIRRIAASFDPRGLGYRSCLVAARVVPDKLEHSAAVINLHPGVSQNYLRNHDFNLWFTIAIAPGSRLGLERTIEILGEEAQCEVIRLLPTLKLLKGSSSDSAEPSPNEVAIDNAAEQEPAQIGERELEFVRILQKDLPLQPRPFDGLAASIGSSGDELISTARNFLKKQQMRKLTAFVDARKPSFSATTMGVWVVPEGHADDFGIRMGDFKAVSHCYLRPVYADWPYNVFTTVHGRSVDECESVLNEIAEATGIHDRTALYPTRELKRVRIALFSPESEAWESARLSPSSASAVS